MANTTVQTYGRGASRVDGELINIGSIEKPTSYSITGKVHRRTTSIANAANAVIYNDELSGFKYLHIASDYDLRVKVTDNTSNTFSFVLKGTGNDNVLGVPLQLGSDKTVNTSVRINTIQVFNDVNANGNTAKVSILVLD